MEDLGMPVFSSALQLNMGNKLSSYFAKAGKATFQFTDLIILRG